MALTDMTRMSENGQVVIPSNIRKEGKFTKGQQFLIIRSGKNLLLKALDKETLRKEFELLEKISESEQQVHKGRYVSVDSDMSPEEIRTRIMNLKWKSSSRKTSRKSSKKSRMRKRSSK